MPSEDSSSPIETLASGIPLSLGLNQYREAMGFKARYGINWRAWDAPKLAQIDTFIHSGLRQCYRPPLVNEARVPHEWSWMRPEGSLVTWQSIVVPAADDANVSSAVFAAGKTTLTLAGFSFASTHLHQWVYRSGVGAFQVQAVTSSTVIVVWGDATGLNGLALAVTPYIVVATTEAGATVLTTNTTQDSATVPGARIFHDSMVGRTLTIGATDYEIIAFRDARTIVVQNEVTSSATPFELLADGDYLLPLDFAASDGDWFNETNKSRPDIKLVDKKYIDRQRSVIEVSGVPCYVAVHSMRTTGENVQRHEAMFYPKPDAEYTLSHQYHTRGYMLTEANPYPPGGPEFAELVLESCLSVLEQRLEEKADGIHTKEFEKKLAAAIEFDKRLGGGNHLPFSAAHQRVSFDPRAFVPWPGLYNQVGIYGS